MKTTDEPINDWQGWLDKFLRGASTEGWAKFMALLDNDEILPWQWAAVYPMLLQNDLTNAMLLACLQLPEAEAHETLASITDRVHALRFGKPPRQMKRELKQLYRQASKNLLRDLLIMADFFQSVFAHYLRDDYDLTGDPNLLMREAEALAAMHQRERALELAGRVGAAALRGKSFWDGWADEGTPEFRAWSLSLSTMLEGHAYLLPFGSMVEERSRVAERVAALSPKLPRELPDLPAAEPPPPLESPEEFIDEWTAILQREEPLSDQEIAAMGERYARVCEGVKTVLSASGDRRLPAKEGEMMGLLATMVGMLRCTDDFVSGRMIDVIRNSDQKYSGKTIENAMWALQQLGSAALKPCFDFVRYTSVEDARDDMLEVTGVLGRGSEEVFDYLSGQFMDTPWEDGKTRYAYPLALLHDARAVPMIADALSDPVVSENEAWELLDALQELGVELEVNRKTRAVTLPDYGTIENVLPENWSSRGEQDEMADEMQAAEEDTEEEERDEDEYTDDDIEYDARGIPHCVGCGAVMRKVGGRWVHPPVIDDEEYDEVEYDERGIPRCPDCGAIMQRVGGEWVHPTALPPKGLDLPRLEPILVDKIGRNDPCPCGSGKKYKYCHGRPGSTTLN